MLPVVMLVQVAPMDRLGISTAKDASEDGAVHADGEELAMAQAILGAFGDMKSYADENAVANRALSLIVSHQVAVDHEKASILQFNMFWIEFA